MSGLVTVLLVCGLQTVHAGDDSPQTHAVTALSFADVRVRNEYSAPAEVVALARTRVAARLHALVDRLHVDVGDSVLRGDPIARLECDDYLDRLEQAEGRKDELEARRKLAQARLERTRRLREQGAASAETLEEVEAERDSLTASLRSQRGHLREANRDVERCDVTAPFAGMVTARVVSEGAWVQPGIEIVRLLDVDRLELRAHLPARQLPAGVELAGAEFRVGERVFAVEHRGAVAESDPQTRMREVRFRFIDVPPLAGSAGRLHWQDPDAAVPAHLLVRREGELGVMILRDDAARFHRLPAAVEGRAASAPELTASDRLIIDGRHAVRAGDRVHETGDPADPAPQ